MCLLCDCNGKKEHICKGQEWELDKINEITMQLNESYQELLEAFSNAFFLGKEPQFYELHGECFLEGTTIYHQPTTYIDGEIKLSEADIILQQQQDSNKYKPKPGTGVTITDGKDINHQRDGFIRDYEGEYYNIFFEPGDKDGKYRRDQFEINNNSIDPKLIPDAVK